MVDYVLIMSVFWHACCIASSLRFDEEHAHKNPVVNVSICGNTTH
jgi:hypothetical protein